MLVAEYSYEEDIEVKQEEAWQLGRREGEIKGRREGELKGKREGKQEGLLLSGRIFQMAKENPNLANERIAEALGCEADEVASVREMFGM